MREASMSLIIVLCLLCLFIGIGSTPALSMNRPETGAIIKDTIRDGYGLLVIYNNWTMDTVAALTDKRVKPLLIVYLRAKESLEIDGIRDGEYGLYFTIGNQWDALNRKFGNVYGYYRYNQPLLFETKDAANEIEYSVFELDLYQAHATNFLPDQFQFPDLKA